MRSQALAHLPTISVEISSDVNNNNQFALIDLNNLKGLKIACLDINSLSKHIDELRVIMLNNPLDILTINETKINESVLDYEINISGFHLIRKRSQQLRRRCIDVYSGDYSF